ncbi:hypothetical protein KR093_004965 [Drosophila rubida]|uniref:Uncharacterized protein n=1 Tax=Drosophila rubida TaxID=30044 RepID=A0AAD4K0R4_9MUSC|nr:hypothetical protein KR093_004965 [Drosophila rubida]
MPNNRSRNRNRNRNKRNKQPNANANANQHNKEAAATSSSPCADDQQQQQHNDIQANSGSLSNGSSAASAAADVAPAGLASNHSNQNHNNEDGKQQVTAPVNQPADQPADLAVTQPSSSSNMGAKHSKQQQQQQQQQQQEQQQQQQQQAVRPQAPGSPRQAKVIVHRIVREQVDEVAATQQQTVEQQTQLQQQQQLWKLQQQTNLQQQQLNQEQLQQQPKLQQRELQAQLQLEVQHNHEPLREQTQLQQQHQQVNQEQQQQSVEQQLQQQQPAEQAKLQQQQQQLNAEQLQQQQASKLEQQHEQQPKFQQQELQTTNGVKEEQSKFQQQQQAQQQQQPLEQLQARLQQEEQSTLQQQLNHEQQQESKLEQHNPEQQQQALQQPQQQPSDAPQSQSLRRQAEVPASLPLQRSTKVIIHQIRVETDAEEQARRGKPSIEEISSTTTTTTATTMRSNSGGSLAGSSSSGALSPPPRYLVESPSPKLGSQVAQFARFARDLQIQELEPSSDCSSGEFNSNASGLQSPLVCEADSEVEAEQPAEATFSPDVPSSNSSSSSRAEQQEQLRQRRVQKRVALESHFLPQLLSPRYLDSILEENELALSRSSSANANNNEPLAARNAKANEAFPRSQLDFSRRHRRREEPVALMLETRLLEQPGDLESCTRLQSTLSPQSEDAELVYLSSSASSSVSDLMELELEQAAALAERALIDLDTDASKLISPPADARPCSPAPTASTTEPASSAHETETETETEADTETEASRESTPVNAHRASDEAAQSPPATPAATPTLAETPTRAAEARATASELGPSQVAGSRSAALSLSATREEFVRNMEKVRELIEMTRREENANANANGNGNASGNANVNVNGNGNGSELQCRSQESPPSSPPPPPVPPPPSSMHYPPPPTAPLAPPSGERLAELRRQESNDSHASDSTQHSQCTAIHMATPTPPPAASTTQAPPTPPLRQQPPPQPQSQPSAVSSFAGHKESASETETEAERIKKLRLLCTETLASMPYGEQMLEELASVAHNITEQQLKEQQQQLKQANNMPYPLPQLPHIGELQLSLDGGGRKDAWLGLPTQADPQLLVCLSPGQRSLVEQPPDQLLHAHAKFVQRRGYHELSEAQVRELDDEQLLQTAAKMRELRKSLTPTEERRVSPVPPPVPAKSAQTAAKAKSQPDDASSQKVSAAATTTTTSSFENKPQQQQQQRQQQVFDNLASSFEQRTSSRTEQQTSSQSSQMSSSSKFPASMESELARMFPSMARQGDIFEEQRKRFSNIEQSSNSNSNIPSMKRYSNIETSRFESAQRTENGQVVYDHSSSSREQQKEGEPTALPVVHQIPVQLAADEVDRAPPVPPPPTAPQLVTSAAKLNGQRNDDAQLSYEECRQRAKAAIEAIAQHNSNGNGNESAAQPTLDSEKLFKDFDALSQQLNAELRTSRVQREQRDKSASLYDLSQSQSQQRRHAHMQELEREIERSARARHERLSSVPRTSDDQQQPFVEQQRARRSESLCNLQQQDDWARYASDLGHSENIARPFAREVEICYQRQQPQRQSLGIRAPRLSASTNDLSSSSYDSGHAYAGARRHAPMLQQAPAQQRPHYASCYSMLERDPNPTYISTTSRRGVSPAPPTPPAPPAPPAYDRQQRRASLPRELHEQQLKYILGKEEALKLEFERLQQERRRLLDEMQRAPSVLQLQAAPRRDSYRTASGKLPTLSEDEVFRQQMAEEWMHKVAEREQRRQHKIIRISKVEEEQHTEGAPHEQANISDEFLSRVRERRHKLSMPADSDWESGAESQPQPPSTAQPGSESDAEASQVRVLEGSAQTQLRELPRHLREFAKFASSEQLEDGRVERMEQQERSETAAGNALSSASQKSSIVKTFRVSRLPPSVQGQVQAMPTPTTTPATTPAMTAKLRIRPQKQTRFLLSPQQLQKQRQRRSWSESDLLKEIDSELQLAKGFLFANVYKVKHEYLSEPETEYERPRKMAQLGRRQYEGIGPVTNDGMPIILRSEVQEPHQHEWYKRLYQTIHKQKNGARPSYKSNGYVSEPEPNYDSDYSTLKYRSPNPLRVQSVSSAVNVRNLNQDDKLYGTMPNPVKSAANSYKNQPGRIENYTTGHSSVSEKEKKEASGAAASFLSCNLEQSKLSPLYTEGNLSRALAKESGYTSDSNLVFRKKELPASSPLSPVEQRQAYKSLQAGGEPPLLGFRKPAPEKTKDLDSSGAPPIPPQPPLKGLSYAPYSAASNGDQPDAGTDVNVHFKTPLRHEYKQNVSEEELAIRQAEHMQKLYQEERRRKYLQELQDMNSRRHTDNFTPSQKSPIALNRYDDFPTDVTLKSLVGPKTVARALYNFQGQSSKELSFRKGDTIYIRRQIDPNWYEGEHNAMIGLLPASYVEIVSRDGARTPSKRPSEGQARAKYNFQAQSGVELSLNKGELVTLTRRVDGNWFEGKIANRKGIFPVSYVEVLTDIGAEDIAARTTTVISSQSTTNLRPNLDVLRTNINNEFNTLTQNGAQPPNGILKDTRTLHKTDALHVDTSLEPLTYRALYKYRPQNSDELEIFEGDLVHVLEKCDDGWFVGTSQRTGCFGTFPGNYVERA